MIEELLDAAERAVPGSRPVSGLVIGPNKEERLKVVVVLFDEAGTPAVVAKVARHPDAAASLDREWNVLSELWRRFPTVPDSVPKPLACEDVAGHRALLTTARPGRPMATRYYTPGHTARRERVAADLERAAAWLRAFTTTTAGPSVDAREALGAWADEIEAGFDALLETTPEDRAVLAELRERIERIDGRLPTASIHGDFWFGNVLLEDDAVSGMLDWEFGRANGLPFRDLYKFPTSYGFYLDRAYPSGRVRGHDGRSRIATEWGLEGAWPNAIGFAYTWFGDGWFPREVVSSVRRTSDAWGLPPGIHSVAFPLFLAEQVTALDVEGFREGYRTLSALFFRHEERFALGSA